MSTDFRIKTDDFQDWLIENEAGPEVDVVLKAMFRRCAEEESGGKEDREAFGAFAEKAGLRPETKSVKKSARILRIFRDAAAVLFIPLASALLWLSLNAGGSEKTADWKEKTTASTETAELVLPDGTAVKLGPCSRIVYPDVFISGERKVFAGGDVFFDVARDPDRKFRVVSDDMDVVVHGTRFRINSFVDSETEDVALFDGSVRLEMHSDSSQLSLSPGEMLRYDRKRRNFERILFDVNSADRVLRAEGVQFIDESLGSIARRLSRRFGVEISVEDEKLAEGRYYASFINGESLSEMLDALNLGGRFRIRDAGGKIKITGSKGSDTR